MIAKFDLLKAVALTLFYNLYKMLELFYKVFLLLLIILLRVRANIKLLRIVSKAENINQSFKQS